MTVSKARGKLPRSSTVAVATYTTRVGSKKMKMSSLKSSEEQDIKARAEEILDFHERVDKDLSCVLAMVLWQKRRKEYLRDYCREKGSKNISDSYNRES